MPQQINQYGISQQNANQFSQMQPNYMQPQPGQLPMSQPFSNTISNSIVWTETEEEGKNWMVGPNNRVFIFVGDNKVLYIKEKNSDGRPLKTEIYDLTKRQVIEEGESIDLSGYVRKEDVQSMIDDAVNKALAENNRNIQNNRNNYRKHPNGGNEQ